MDASRFLALALVGWIVGSFPIAVLIGRALRRSTSTDEDELLGSAEGVYREERFRRAADVRSPRAFHSSFSPAVAAESLPQRANDLDRVR